MTFELALCCEFIKISQTALLSLLYSLPSLKQLKTHYYFFFRKVGPQGSTGESSFDVAFQAFQVILIHNSVYDK